MEMPDVLGFTLDDALIEFQKRGFTVADVSVTRPIKATEPKGIARIVRLSTIDETKVRVVVAYEEYVKGGVQYGIQNN